MADWLLAYMIIGVIVWLLACLITDRPARLSHTFGMAVGWVPLLILAIYQIKHPKKKDDNDSAK